jgi:hypothetical protein
MERYAIVIKLTGEILNNSLFAWSALKNQFGIKYISSHSPSPHITLAAGQCEEIQKVLQVIKEAATEFSPFELQGNGLGVLVKETPVIYIRWLHSKKLRSLFEFLEDSLKKTWEISEKNFRSEYWMVKTTLAGSDVSYSKLASALEFLMTIDFEMKMEVEGLSLFEYDQEGERELKILYF